MGARAWSIFPTSFTATSWSRCGTAIALRSSTWTTALASIAWLDGQDFKPEFLYEKLKEMH